MNQGETVYIIGESRTNLDNAITKVYGTFYIAFEIIPETEEIIEVEDSGTYQGFYPKAVYWQKVRNRCRAN